MGFKLNSPIKIDNVPQYEVAFTYDNNKDTEITPVARANDNFSIIYDKNQNDPVLRAKAKSHETEHLRQMFGADGYKPGDLKYGPAGVEYKGKFYDRNNPNFDESDSNLPYEQPAYEAGESFKDPSITPKDFNQPAFSMIGERGADNMNVSPDEDFGVGPKKWSTRG